MVNVERDSINNMNVPHGVMFHHFVQEYRADAIGGITSQRLEEIILGYGLENVLPAQEWFERSITNSLDPGNVCITFDDALRSQIDLALPILSKYGLTAFWFIYSAVFEGCGQAFEAYRKFYNSCYTSFDEFFESFLKYVEYLETSCSLQAARRLFAESDYLSEYEFYSDQDREYRYLRDRVLGQEKFMKLMDNMLVDRGVTFENLVQGLWMNNDDLVALADDGHIIGLHTYSHPTSLNSLTYAEQYNEYEKNYNHIQRVTGCRPQSVAHPVNSYGAETLKILRSMGIKLGFRSDIKKREYGLLENPRQDCADIR